ncbi:hypothetical protein QA811_02020 [Streptomyces sp. B21-102]|uniref:hypothetical protein n=1 Tax=Streptomyces sp. B21-102 TaxID=3039416 RepID=UPI002FF18B39
MTATSVERVNGTPLPAEPRFEYDPVAHAEAEAIRTRAEAEREALLVAAEAEAKAKLATAEEEARKLKLANDKAEGRAQEEQAARAARIAESERKRKEAQRAQADADRAAEQAEAAKTQAADEIAAADEKWRSYAIRFAIVCGIVSLPVQMSFFWNPHAPWMAAAPIMLEGAAWVVHRGARAAAVGKRPVWHYRAIVWLLALVAAGVNLYHGLHSFDPGTALSTAFASIAGPGVWDLHEHGRLRKRDGVLTRRERKAADKAERAEADRKAAEEARRTAEKEAAAKAAEEERQEMAARREREFPKVWAEAVKIGAALGKAPDDPAVWPRAYRNIEGCDPGESIESITARRAAEKRVQAALASAPVSTLSKTTNAQRASQVPGAKKPRVYTPPKNRGKRTKGDVKYTPAARNQASIAAKQATEKKDSQ